MDRRLTKDLKINLVTFKITGKEKNWGRKVVLFKMIWYVLWAPGYIVLWLGFFFPTESGKNRNVAKTGRSWRNRHIMAPIYTIGLLYLFAFIFPADVQYILQLLSFS